MALPIQTFRSSPFKGISEKVAPHLLDDGESPSCNGIQSEPVGAISKQKGSLKWITTNIPPNPVNGICAFKPSDTQEIDVISGSEFRRYNVNGVYQTPNKTGIRTVLFSCDKDNKTIYTHSYGGSFDITNAVESFTVANNPYGVAFDGTNLWYCDQVLNKLYKLSGISGTPLAEYLAPTGAGISGLCWDGTDLWCCGYTDNKVYKVNKDTGVFTYVFTVGDSVGKNLTSLAIKENFIWLAIANTTQATEGITKIARYSLSGVFDYSFNYPISTISSDWEDVAMSDDGNTIVTGGTIGTKLYMSIDCGKTWLEKSTSRKWYRIAISYNGQMQLAIDYSGTARKLLVSNNYGDSWIEKETTKWWSDVAMSKDGKTQVAVVETVAGAARAYISKDYGDTWVAKTTTDEQNKYVAMSSNGQRITISINGGCIQRSIDGGETWLAKQTIGAYFGVIDMSSTGLYQSMILSDRIFTSSDYGVTWTARAFIDSWWSSIAVSDNGQKQVACILSYSTSNIYVSIDYGVTWTAKAFNKSWSAVAISADGIKQVAVPWGHIYISKDSGENWLTARPTGIVLDTNETMFVSDDFYQKIYKMTSFGELLSTYNSPSTSPSGVDYVASIPLSFADNKFDFVVFMNTLFFCNGSYIYKWTGVGSNFTIVYDASNKTKYLALFGDRLISAGHNASDICYSNLLDPETGYIDNYISVNPDDGDKITGLIVHSNNLIVFKEKSKWRMSPTGDYDNPFYLTKIDDVGALSHHSLIIVNDMVYFCNLNGVYRFTGASSEKISTKIDTSYKTWLGLGATLTSIDVVYIKELNQIRWTIQSTIASYTITYNLLTDSWFVLNDYDPQGGGWTSTNFCVIKPWETSATEIILASSKNYLMQTNDGDSFDVQTNKAIPSVMTSKVFDFGIPHKQKTIKRGYFTVKNEMWPTNITLSVSVDSKEFESLSPIICNVPDVGDKHTQLIDLKEKIGKTFQFKFENNGENQPWTLYEYVIEYQVLPRII